MIAFVHHELAFSDQPMSKGYRKHPQTSEDPQEKSAKKCLDQRCFQFPSPIVSMYCSWTFMASNCLKHDCGLWAYSVLCFFHFVQICFIGLGDGNDMQIYAITPGTFLTQESWDFNGFQNSWFCFWVDWTCWEPLEYFLWF